MDGSGFAVWTSGIGLSGYGSGAGSFRGRDVRVRADREQASSLLAIGDLAAQGRAILLISSELPELLALCDRVLVMSEGRLTANLSRSEATQETIMQAAVPRTARKEQAA